jgi:transposase
MSQVICGVDVSSDELEACIIGKDNKAHLLQDKFRNSKRGIKGLLFWLKHHRVELVVMEASGGYEQNLKEGLRGSGIKSRVVNPAQVRHFARGIGKRAKTDRIDAQVIARFGQVVKLDESQELSHVELELKELIKRREELKEMSVAEKNRLRLAQGVKRRSIKRVIKVLEKEIELIDAKLKELSQKDKRIKHKIQLLKKHKGVGFTTAVGLIALLPELGKINRKQVGALAGVSPFNRESGKWKGKSFITGGRARVRKILYMSALVAIRFNKRLKELYQRLLASGKAKKVALVAVMRKLVVICNATLKYV